MVAQHSQKKLIRKTMAVHPGLSYRQAAGWVQKIHVHQTFRASGADLDVAREVAGIIDSSQRDLIVFGTAHSGKSVALREVFAASNRYAPTILDAEKYWYADPAGCFVGADYTRYLGAEKIEQWIREPLLNNPTSSELVGYDEIRQPSDELAVALGKVPQRALVVHAIGSEQAIERIGYLSDGFELKDPIILSSLWYEDEDGRYQRRLTIHRS